MYSLYALHIMCYRRHSHIQMLFFWHLSLLISFVNVRDYITEKPLPSAQSLESEQEKDDLQLLKQASDRATVLQDELMQAAERERQLQMQLDKMKHDLSQLQMQLEHRFKEFDDFKLRSVRLWEQEMEKRESRSNCFRIHALQ